MTHLEPSSGCSKGRNTFSSKVKIISKKWVWIVTKWCVSGTANIFSNNEVQSQISLTNSNVYIIVNHTCIVFNM